MEGGAGTGSGRSGSSGESEDGRVDEEGLERTGSGKVSERRSMGRAPVYEVEPKFSAR